MQFEDEYISSVRTCLAAHISSIWAQIYTVLKKQKETQSSSMLHIPVAVHLLAWFHFATKGTAYRGKIQNMEGHGEAVNLNETSTDNLDATCTTFGTKQKDEQLQVSLQIRSSLEDGVYLEIVSRNSLPGLGDRAEIFGPLP